MTDERENSNDMRQYGTVRTTGSIRALACDDDGTQYVTLTPQNLTTTVEAVGSTAVAISDSPETLISVTGLPSDTTLLIKEGADTVVSLNPTDVLRGPIAIAAGATATVVGLAALATTPITFWLA